MRNVGEKNFITILCIDDEQSVLNSLKRAFRNKPYQVIATTNLDEAYSYYVNHEPEIVLSDYRMPGLNGEQLMNELQFESKRAKWIFLSGYSPAQEMSHLIDSGEVCAFVSKPWKIEEIVSVIDQIVLSHADKEVLQHG